MSLAKKEVPGKSDLKNLGGQPGKSLKHPGLREKTSGAGGKRGGVERGGKKRTGKKPLRRSAHKQSTTFWWGGKVKKLLPCKNPKKKIEWGKNSNNSAK